MNIETLLLVIESILLTFTIFLLLYSIKEGRERKKLILQVERATKTLTRLEYFLTVIESMMDAKTEVIACITGRHPSGDDEKKVREIVDAIRRLRAKGIIVRYMLPKFYDRLYTGYLYTVAGAEVRFSACHMIHSIRYMIVDQEVVVIGIPESAGEKEATKKGYRILSPGLALILRDHFYRCWGENLDLSGYLMEVLHQTGASIDQLAMELGISREELVKFTKD